MLNNLLGNDLVFSPTEETFDGFALSHFLQVRSSTNVSLSKISKAEIAGAVTAVVSSGPNAVHSQFKALLAAVLEKTCTGEWSKVDISKKKYYH